MPPPILNQSPNFRPPLTVGPWRHFRQFRPGAPTTPAFEETTSALQGVVDELPQGLANADENFGGVHPTEESAAAAPQPSVELELTNIRLSTEDLGSATSLPLEETTSVVQPTPDEQLQGSAEGGEDFGGVHPTEETYRAAQTSEVDPSPTFVVSAELVTSLPLEEPSTASNATDDLPPAFAASVELVTSLPLEEGAQSSANVGEEPSHAAAGSGEDFGGPHPAEDAAGTPATPAEETQSFATSSTEVFAALPLEEASQGPGSAAGETTQTVAGSSEDFGGAHPTEEGTPTVSNASDDSAPTFVASLELVTSIPFDESGTTSPPFAQEVVGAALAPRDEDFGGAHPTEEAPTISPQSAEESFPTSTGRIEDFISALPIEEIAAGLLALEPLLGVLPWTLGEAFSGAPVMEETGAPLAPRSLTPVRWAGILDFSEGVPTPPVPPIVPTVDTSSGSHLEVYFERRPTQWELEEALRRLLAHIRQEQARRIAYFRIVDEVEAMFDARGNIVGTVQRKYREAEQGSTVFRQAILPASEWSFLDALASAALPAIGLLVFAGPAIAAAAIAGVVAASYVMHPIEPTRGPMQALPAPQKTKKDLPPSK